MLLLSAVVPTVCLAVNPEPAPTPLRQGAAQRACLQGEEVRTYLIELGAAAAVVVTADQQGLDVTLEVHDGQGEVVATADSPVDRHGPESLLVEPRAGETYQLLVRPTSATDPAGCFEVRIEALGTPSSPADSDRRKAEGLMTAAANAYAAGTASAWSSSMEAYAQALPVWQALGDAPQVARTVYCIAGLDRLLQRHREAIARYREVLPLWQALGDREKQAATWNGQGLSHWALGEISDARTAFDEAFALYTANGDQPGAARARNNICLTEQSGGQLDEALQ